MKDIAGYAPQYAFGRLDEKWLRHHHDLTV